MNIKQLREVAKAAALNADWDSYEEVFHPIAILRLLDVVEALKVVMAYPEVRVYLGSQVSNIADGTIKALEE